MVEGELMGYKSMVERNVDKAFKLIGDLAITVTLNRKTKATFNFDTLDVKTTLTPNLVTSAVLLESSKKTAEHNTRSTSLILKTKEIGDINLFDSVTIGADLFKIGPIISTDGYITNVEIFKEG